MHVWARASASAGPLVLVSILKEDAVVVEWVRGFRGEGVMGVSMRG